jgi:hypothetical protein
MTFFVLTPYRKNSGRPPYHKSLRSRITPLHDKTLSSSSEGLDLMFITVVKEKTGVLFINGIHGDTFVLLRIGIQGNAVRKCSAANKYPPLPPPLFLLDGVQGPSLEALSLCDVYFYLVIQKPDTFISPTQQERSAAHFF